MPNVTFAQHLLNNILPKGIRVTRSIDKKYLEELLTEVSEKHPDDYSRVVSEIKKLGDNLSTWEAFSFGIDELDVPNRDKRDVTVRKYQDLVKKEKDPEKLEQHLVDFQNDLADINVSDDLKDDATLAIRSALGGKKNQLMKLRTSPGVVGGHDGKIVSEIFPTSYAEGVDPLQYWLGAAESRKNLAQGQVSTSAPGELSKVISNVLNTAVVSSDNCGTKRGIDLATNDENIIGRYLAAAAGGYERDTKISPDIQKDLLRKKIETVLVRSPQTCQAKDGSVCAMCMGTRPGTGRDYKVGDNAGMIASGSLAEPLTQMALSAKHSTAMAGGKKGLTGEKGFRTFVEMPDKFENRKVLCEVYGKVHDIKKAPQGGQIITVQQTKSVPERFIKTAMKSSAGKGYLDYYVSPDLKILSDISVGTEVHPGMELTDGVDNVKDVARLRNLGVARTKSAQGMYNVYKDTGFPMARTHFELLARNSHPYVKIERAPAGFPFKRGETVEYNKLEDALSKLSARSKAVSDAIGQTLAEGVLDITAGTEITPQLAERLLNSGVQRVKATTQVETSPATTPMTRVVNQSEDWISGLNHRFLQNQIKDAASYGKSSNIHSYKPMSAYAFGTEMQQDEHGRY